MGFTLKPDSNPVSDSVSASPGEPTGNFLNPIRLARRIFGTIILSCLIALVFSPAAFSAELAPAQVSVAPFVGGGTTSVHKAIRNNSGLSVSADLPIKTSARTFIAPRVEAINSLISTTYDGPSTIAATYDHRILAAGIVAERALTSASDSAGKDGDTSIYGAITGGKVFSKLVIDESTANSFSQTSYSGITGQYLAAELGVKIPIKNKFSVTFGLGANSLTLSQEVAGIGQGENVVDRAYLTSESERNAADILPTKVVQKTIIAKAGFNLGF